MNFIIHNGFRLPILGARITDSNTQEKEEYLRLIKKIYPNFIIKGTLAYYGIRENVYSSICAINEETALDYFQTPLHPSILHINGKNLSEETVKIINKMVDKVLILEKIKAIVKEECFEISESTKCSGWDYLPNHPDSSYRNNLPQRYYNKPLHEKTCNELIELFDEHEVNVLKRANAHIESLTAENQRLREATKKRYLDGFTEGYQMAIEDIQEGNPLNKAAKTEIPKLEFYKKLLGKLDLITSGELNLVDYKSEVVNKIQALSGDRKEVGNGN